LQLDCNKSKKKLTLFFCGYAVCVIYWCACRYGSSGSVITHLLRLIQISWRLCLRVLTHTTMLERKIDSKLAVQLSVLGNVNTKMQ